ncbi:MAG TPA: MarR family transcriptional regulator [Dermatophilaceae bacterium]|nr:MarR family transcriptional regulator [Dermatophilaceae bacterium]
MPSHADPLDRSVATEATARLAAEFIRVGKLFAAMKEHAPAPMPGVDFTHFAVLNNLTDGSKRVSDLASCIHAEVSTVSRQVSHLTALGVIAKDTDPHDGRVAVLSLTDTGRAVVDRMTASRGAWLGRVLSQWTPEELDRFAGDVTRFADDLEDTRARTDAPADVEPRPH